MTQYYRDGGPKAFTPTAGKVFFRLPRFLRLIVVDGGRMDHLLGADDADRPPSAAPPDRLAGRAQERLAPLAGA